MVIDGRSQLGRRLHDLATGFAVQLGGWSALSDTMAANVRKAAELTALAEQTRADALRNGNINPLALVRLEGAANRAVRALNLDRKREPALIPLRERLAAEAADEPQGDPVDTSADIETLVSERPNDGEAILPRLLRTSHD